jgi:hypothetical protein
VAGLEVNTVKPEYMPMSRHQNAGQNSKMWKTTKSSVTLTIENYINEEVKGRSNFRNAWHIQLKTFRISFYLKR